MRRASLLLPALLSTIVLGGCGGTDQAGPVAVLADGPAAVSAPGGGVTDGRTGDAVTGSGSGPLQSLSTGGRLDPSPSRDAGARRDGVAAGDACTDTDLLPARDNLARIEASTFCLLNGERADRGLPALTRNARLARAAAGHSADMVANSYFAHEGRNGSDVRDRVDAVGYIPARARWVIGENLAWGTGALATPRAIMNAWMNSAGHKANILHADYREIGFGIVVGNPREANGFGATYATEFGVTGNPKAVSPDVGEPAARTRRAARRRTVSDKARRARKARASRRARASAASVGRLTGRVAGSAAGA